MKITFFGRNASTFVPGFAELLNVQADIHVVSDSLDQKGEAEALASSDVVISIKYTADLPALSARLFQLPAAGYDGVDFSALASSCAVCNAFGHENAIAEYVMTALLMRHVPISDADARLRHGDWHYWAGGPNGLRTELSSQTIGIVGHGHIGKAIAQRAQAFGMKVHVANRSPLGQTTYAGTWSLDGLNLMAAKVDIMINTLPLAPETKGLINSTVLSALPPHAIVMNVGRGAVIDERDLFDALASEQLGGAIIDTWYVYPRPDNPNPMPGNLPFESLPNVIITPHMSGWTNGTVRRRTETCAENVNRLAAGQPLLNQIGTGKLAR